LRNPDSSRLPFQDNASVHGADGSVSYSCFGMESGPLNSFSTLHTLQPWHLSMVLSTFSFATAAWRPAPELIALYVWELKKILPSCCSIRDPNGPIMPNSGKVEDKLLWQMAWTIWGNRPTISRQVQAPGEKSGKIKARDHGHC
jgi:hypothetical protein